MSVFVIIVRISERVKSVSNPLMSFDRVDLPRRVVYRLYVFLNAISLSFCQEPWVPVPSIVIQDLRTHHSFFWWAMNAPIMSGSKIGNFSAFLAISEVCWGDSSYGRAVSKERSHFVLNCLKCRTEALFALGSERRSLKIDCWWERFQMRLGQKRA